jgi:hypothetical protein
MGKTGIDTANIEEKCSSLKRSRPSASMSKARSHSGPMHDTNNVLDTDLRLGASHDTPITLDSNSVESVTSDSSDVVMRDARG